MRWDKVYPILDGAVEALVESDDSLHDRLDTSIASLELLMENDLPLAIRKEYVKLAGQIAAYHEGGETKDLQANLAKAIYSFFKQFMVEAWPPTSQI